MSTGAKVAIGVGIAIIAAAAIYFGVKGADNSATTTDFSQVAAGAANTIQNARTDVVNSMQKAFEVAATTGSKYPNNEYWRKMIIDKLGPDFFNGWPKELISDYAEGARQAWSAVAVP